MSKDNETYEFGPFRLDAEKRILLRDGERVSLNAIRFNILLELARRRYVEPESVVDKYVLFEIGWPHQRVDRNDERSVRSASSLLTNSIFHLRKDLKDDDEVHIYIEAVRGVGYRLIPDVVKAGGHNKILIVVLPFKPMKRSDIDNDYFGLAIASAIITRLNTIKGIIVRPRSAILKYSEPAADRTMQDIAREQEAEFILTGLFQKVGQLIRVDAELLKMPDSILDLAKEYREEVTDDFAVQELIAKQIAGDVAEHFGLKLSSEEKEQIKKVDTKSTKAYEYYVMGRCFWNKFTRSDFNKAIYYFELAINEDPQYAKAYDGIASCYTWLGIYNLLPPKTAFDKAETWANKALAIDSELAGAHTSLAFIDMCNKWDWEAAESKLKDAIRFTRNHTKSHIAYAILLTARGRFTEALSEIDIALEIYSASPIINVVKSVILYEACRDADSIEQFRKTLEIDPNFDAAHYGLALAYAQKKMFEEAITSAQTAVDLARNGALNLTVLGYVYARSGKIDEARKVLDELKRARKRRPYISPFHMAAIYLAMEDKRQTLKWLEKACAARDPWVIWLKVDPRFDDLRGDPGFNHLLDAIGL